MEHELLVDGVRAIPCIRDLIQILFIVNGVTYSRLWPQVPRKGEVVSLFKNKKMLKVRRVGWGDRFREDGQPIENKPYAVVELGNRWF